MTHIGLPATRPMGCAIIRDAGLYSSNLPPISRPPVVHFISKGLDFRLAAPMQKRMQFSGGWRDYQARILAEMESHFDDQRLHIVAAPGAGKTVLGLEIVRRIGRPALVFAPAVAIREQWAQRLYPLFLSDPPACGEISRDLAVPAQLTLATYQALDSFRRGASLDMLIETLNCHGPLTLVLDEAHHLRREWWGCLEQLAAKLDDVRIVSLTATPPYDATFAEWSRYESLCGLIDLEIGIPELVRNHDLCAHQDHVILSEPAADTIALLESRRRVIAGLQDELRNDATLIDYLQSHPWLVEPDAFIEEILDNPEMLSATLILLASAGRPLPKAPMKLLGISGRDVPMPSAFWLERFLEGITGKLASTFSMEGDWSKQLTVRLHRQGLIEGGKVRLHQTHSTFRLLASSLAKLDSIVDVARAEEVNLGAGLRMVILSDHIRADEFPASCSDEFHPAKLGVVPIFETLRRAEVAQDHLAILTGSLVVIPRSALSNIEAAALQVQLNPSSIRTFPLPCSPEHVRLEIMGQANADLVRLVTHLFSLGDVRILVGTQSLLGEGWDAPPLNSLVLASNTASFMLSNQMRGRAIRVDPANLGKVSNIWHLATVEPVSKNFVTNFADAVDWGHLHDESAEGLSDLALLQRRFRSFEGISNDSRALIESGLGRLAMDTTEGFEAANQHSFAFASDRAAIVRRWSDSLGEGKVNSRVRETAAANYAPRSLAWHDTLHSLVWSAAGSAAFAVANMFRNVDSIRGFAFIGMSVAGVGVFASLPKLAKAIRLMWRNSSLEGSLKEVGETILLALHEAKIANEEDITHSHFEVRTSMDGRKDIVLTGTSRNTERQVMQGLAELLGPVQNPRYLLVRYNWLGWKRRRDYHAIPTALGAKQETAQRFAALWSAKVGSSQLVYTRTASGRRTLLRARAQSFASGFQRSVQRRSIWL